VGCRNFAWNLRDFIVLMSGMVGSGHPYWGPSKIAKGNQNGKHWDDLMLATLHRTNVMKVGNYVHSEHGVIIYHIWLRHNILD